MAEDYPRWEIPEPEPLTTEDRIRLRELWALRGMDEEILDAMWGPNPGQSLRKLLDTQE